MDTGLQRERPDRSGCEYRLTEREQTGQGDDRITERKQTGQGLIQAFRTRTDRSGVITGLQREERQVRDKYMLTAERGQTCQG